MLLFIAIVMELPRNFFFNNWRSIIAFLLIQASMSKTIFNWFFGSFFFRKCSQKSNDPVEDYLQTGTPLLILTFFGSLRACNRSLNTMHKVGIAL